MRILMSVFSPPSGTWGGITRIIALSREAEAAGHAVAVTASGELADLLSDRGLRVYPMPESTFLGLPRGLSRRIATQSQHRTPPIKPGRSFGNMWLVFLFVGFANRRFLRAAVEAERSAIEKFRPDIIFTDANPVAFLSALISGLPMACTYSAIVQRGAGSYPWRKMKRAVGSVLRESGHAAVSPDALFSRNRVLKIIPSIPELDETDQSRDDVVYVGPLVDDLGIRTTFDVDPNRRYVFVYVGTGSVPLKTLYEVLPRVFPADHPMICVVGSQSIGTVERIGNVEFHPYIPTQKILPYCEWTICHGGQNTIVQSLLYGVPLILFPGPIFERRWNAEKVQRSGAGVMGELPDFSADWLREVLSRRKRYEAKAVELRNRLKELGGVSSALRALERWSTRAR